VSSYSRDRIERVVMWPSMNPVVETNIAAVKGSKGSSDFLSTLREYCSFVIVIVVVII
jgi:hypothetical protein